MVRDRRGRSVERKDGFAHRGIVVSESCLLWWGSTSRGVGSALATSRPRYIVRLVVCKPVKGERVHFRAQPPVSARCADPGRTRGCCDIVGAVIYSRVGCDSVLSGSREIRVGGTVSDIVRPPG